MITIRDKRILLWIEKYKSITISQCAKLFFSNNKMAYDQSRKRLRYLNKEGLIRRYRKNPHNQTVYFMDKRLREHDLKTMDVIVELQQFNITQTILQNKIQINQYVNYVIDATVVIDARYPLIIEVDYTHYTSDKKIKDIINHLENKHKTQYIFLIIRQAAEETFVYDIGSWSKLIITDVLHFPYF